MIVIYNVVDIAAFILIGISVAYIFIFSLASLRSSPPARPLLVRNRRKILVLIPSYKDDAVILNSVESALEQDYPKDRFDVVVISDCMGDQVNSALEQMSITLFKISVPESTKALALNYAIDNIASDDYDIVVILDADNIVTPTFLKDINNSYNSGMKAIQAHRVAANLDTDIAILDALSEEINNSIFRKGHVALGMSSALIGSGMAFDFKWFKRNVKKISTAGEDKEIEILLLKDHVFIDYLPDTFVYDRKTRSDRSFYNQRRRWLAAQYSTLNNSIRDLPKAIFTMNIDYCDKLFQWMMLPRVVILGCTVIMGSIALIFDWQTSVKWWFLLFILALSFAMATPDNLITADFKKAVRKTPKLFILMVLNFIRIKGINKKFVHVDHSKITKDQQDK